MNGNKIVVVALSGGVDSSVSAFLLKKAGYNVIAIFMKNWYNNKFIIGNKCPWLKDSNDALLVANKLDIPFHIIDLSKEYKKEIIDYMFEEYEKGRTPNPDVLCNKKIKFNVFLKIATSLNADFIATGHYVKKHSFINENNKIIYQLFIAKDLKKDQSYFLCQLNQKQISKSLFPLGDFTKKEVRIIAKKLNLVTADKKDSQGLCFVGKISLNTFLQQKIIKKKGKIIEISSTFFFYNESKPYFHKLIDQLIYESNDYNYSETDGKIIGEHFGSFFFTKGQRKGLKIGGRKQPLFIISTDVKNNIIYVGEGKNHPGLYKKTIFISLKNAHWIRQDLKIKINEKIFLHARVRYRQNLYYSILYRTKIGYFLRFNEKISSISKGQFAVCYLFNELIFSGVIN